MPYGEESAYAAQAALKKKSPAYKKSSGFKMKGSPMQRNFNIGVATKTGVSGLAPKDSPLQWAWLANIGQAIAAGAQKAGAAIAKGATAAGKAVGKAASWIGKGVKKGVTAVKESKLGKQVTQFSKSDMGKQMKANLALQTLSNMGRREERQQVNPASTTFANIKFGTGGSSPLSLLSFAIKDEKKRRKSGEQSYKTSPKMTEYIQSSSPHSRTIGV